MADRASIVVLTGGGGSSVLTGLVARKGYWLSDDTKTVAYQTYENARLVDLDGMLLKASGFRWHDIGDLPPPDVERIRRLATEIDLTEYRAFIEECERHRPWIWKDPRLCYTAGFWQQLIDLRNTRIIHMERDLRQSWIGSVLRGRCIKYRDLCTLQNGHSDAVRHFLREIGAEYHHVTFEQLTAQPDQTLRDLGAFLDLDLTVDDLKAVYRGKLYQERWSTWDDLRARARFFYCSTLRGTAERFPRTA